VHYKNTKEHVSISEKAKQTKKDQVLTSLSKRSFTD